VGTSYDRSTELIIFLQAHNINANQIRQDAHARRAAALAAQQTEEGDDENALPSEPEAPAPARRKESKAQSAKRKKEEEVGLAQSLGKDHKLIFCRKP
jgi:DNA repair protein RAD7